MAQSDGSRIRAAHHRHGTLRARRRVDVGDGRSARRRAQRRLADPEGHHPARDRVSSSVATRPTACAPPTSPRGPRQRRLATAGIEPRDVDLLIFASASHDVAEPATANMVQTALGCDRAAVMDVKNACNSFLNGLDVAQAFIETGRATRVVVAAGECLSPHHQVGHRRERRSADPPGRAHVGRRRRGVRRRGERRSRARCAAPARSSRTVATGSSRPCSAAAPATARRRSACSSSAGARSCSSWPSRASRRSSPTCS